MSRSAGKIRLRQFAVVAVDLPGTVVVGEGPRLQRHPAQVPGVSGEVRVPRQREIVHAHLADLKTVRQQAREEPGIFLGRGSDGGRRLFVGGKLAAGGGRRPVAAGQRGGKFGEFDGVHPPGVVPHRAEVEPRANLLSAEPRQRAARSAGGFKKLGVNLRVLPLQRVKTPVGVQGVGGVFVQLTPERLAAQVAVHPQPQTEQRAHDAQQQQHGHPDEQPGAAGGGRAAAGGEERHAII